MSRQILLLVVISLLLIGCMNNNESTLQPSGDQPLELTKLSTQGITDQQPANQAKQYLSQYDEVSRVRAVNVGNDLIVAVDVRQRDRFLLDSIESDLRKELITQYSQMDITLSTDKKLIIELEKLEKRIDKKDISKKKLQKKVNDLKKLSKEET